MNNSLDIMREIDKTQLSEKLYFQSLLEQAHNKGLLSENDIERLQYECLNLLAYKTERYNSGDSSSILIEKAQSIMTSNLFTIGLWLKTYPNPDDAVTALLNESIETLYEKGRKRIDTMLMAAKAVHKKLLGQLVETENEFYRLTIEDGINGFFKLYYADFSAQEIHITADYPIYNPIPQYEGIEFISAYLNALYCENQFCTFFSANDIHHLLCGYAKNYQGLLINIYEFVLTAAIGCAIAGTDMRRLDITEEGMKYLQQIFVKKPKSNVFNIVKKSVDEIACHFQCSNELEKYIRNSLPLIAGRIEVAAQRNELNHVFFIPDYPGNRPKISFSFGEKMDNELYRKVIEEIGQCRFAQDKIAIIKEHIHSLADLEDVLLDADLSQEETHAVLCELELPEIAVFLKKYPLKPHMDITDYREKEHLLRNYLHDFLGRLPEEQQAVILNASVAIEEIY